MLLLKLLFIVNMDKILKIDFLNGKSQTSKRYLILCHKITQVRRRKKLTMTANDVSIRKGNRKAI